MCTHVRTSPWPLASWLVVVLLVPSAGMTQPRGWTFAAREMLPSDLSRNEIILNGAVVIRSDTLTVFCDRGLYLGDEGRFIAEGSVRVESGSFRASAPRGSYEFGDSLAILSGGATAREPGRLIQATVLKYHVGQDSLVASGDVCVCDSARALEAHGETGWFRRSSSDGFLEGSPEVRVLHEDGSATTVRSRVMRILDGGTVLAAEDSVHLVTQGVVARADRGTFYPDEGRGLLEGNPKVSRGAGRGSGDRMEVFMDAGRLRRVRMAGSAVWTEPASADSAFTNELSADILDLRFSAGTVGAVDARGGAHALYLRPGKDGGTNDLRGDTLALAFVDGRLSSVDVAGDVSGRFVPLEGGEVEEIAYTAQHAAFDLDADSALLDGEAAIAYQTVTVEADRVEIDVRDRFLVATGSPVLRDVDEELRGARMRYDLTAGRGVVSTGETMLEKAFYRGSQMARVGGRELDVRGGEFTTCDHDPPHYSFWAKRAKVYLKDRVVAEPVVFKVYGIPIMALPSWVFPIRRGRQSGFLTPDFSVRGPLGVGGTRNFFRNLGYYLVLGDYADVRAAADWEEDGPTVLKGRLRYAWRYRIERGSIAGTFQAKERNRGWSLDFDHVQRLPLDFRLTADIRLAKSKSYLDDQLFDQTERMNASTLRSHATLSRSWKGTSFRGSWTRTEDFVNDKTTETAPDVALSFPAGTLFGGGSGTPAWWGTATWSFGSRFHNKRVLQEGDDDLQTTATHALGLSWSPARVLRYLSLRVSTGFDDVWQFRDRSNDLGRTRWGRPRAFSLTASTKLYGLWERPVGPVVAARHVVTPSVTLSYTPDFFLYGWDFRSGALPEEGDRYRAVLSAEPGKRLGLGLQNLFQAKIRTENGERHLDQLASLNFSTSYDMEGKNKDAYGDPAPWGNLSTSASFRPTSLADFTLSLTHEPRHRHGKLRTFAFSGLNERSSLRFGGQLGSQTGRSWSLSLSHSLARAAGDDVTSHSLSASYSLGLTPGWRIDGEWSYDIEEDRTVSRRFHIERNLHCWEAIVDIQRSAVEWRYTILLRVNETLYRDIKVEHQERRGIY
jgi:lipopolysaccharide assembly outer membrane protein LptD (OstA)